VAPDATSARLLQSAGGITAQSNRRAGWHDGQRVDRELPRMPILSPARVLHAQPRRANAASTSRNRAESRSSSSMR
jgi:hypothetical protein